jgi:hypothetical protein
MSSPHTSAPDYYFVPLGRERGGYLDLLGLPPDVSEDEAGAKEGEYRLEIEKKFKAARKTLKEKKTRGELTEHEFEKQAKALEEELKNQPLMKLGELKNKFDALQAERRAASQDCGPNPSTQVWMEMYRSFGTDRESCWHFLIKPRPMANVAPALLGAIRSRWLGFLGSTAAGEKAAPPVLASAKCNPAAISQLAELTELIEERNLVHLLASDLLWMRVRFTNRRFWANQIAEWLKDTVGRGPSFRTEADGPVTDAVHYPALCRPTNLAIDRLDAEPLNELAQQPVRTQGKSIPLDLAEPVARTRGASEKPAAEQNTRLPAADLLGSRAKPTRQAGANGSQPQEEGM